MQQLKSNILYFAGLMLWIIKHVSGFLTLNDEVSDNTTAVLNMSINVFFEIDNFR